MIRVWLRELKFTLHSRKQVVSDRHLVQELSVSARGAADRAIAQREVDWSVMEVVD